MLRISRATRDTFEAGKPNGFALTRPRQRVWLEKPGAVFVVFPDGEALLVGYGHEFSFEVDDWLGGYCYATQAGVYEVEAHAPVLADGKVVHTNFDKRRSLSPLEAHLRLQLRRMAARDRERAQERAAHDRRLIAERGLEAPKPPAPEPAGSRAEPETPAVQVDPPASAV